jgi:hypothetical protein
LRSLPLPAFEAIAYYTSRDTFTHTIDMTSIDTLLSLSTELAKLGNDITEIGSKLTQAAAALQQEAANVAEEMSRQWGVDVSVNVGIRPGMRCVNGAGENEVVVRK